MKSEKGITLVTLVLYSTIMLLIITVVALIKVNVDKNISDIEAMKAYIPEMNKISMYMLAETKDESNNIKKISGDGNSVEFTNGNKYIFVDNNIYKIDNTDKKIKICEGIENCLFQYDTENGKDIIKVTVQIGNKEIITKTMEYIFV